MGDRGRMRLRNKEGKGMKKEKKERRHVIEGEKGMRMAGSMKDKKAE